MVEFFLKYWIVFLLLAGWICFNIFMNIHTRRKEKKRQEKDMQKKTGEDEKNQHKIG